MAGRSTDVTEAEPLEITERSRETSGKFVRFETTVHPSGSGTGADLSHRRYIVDNPDEHVHPRQEETVEVLSGEYTVVFEGTEYRLTEGNGATIPRNTAHRHWNPTDRPVRVAHELRPPHETEALVETMYALAQAGRTDEKGMPNLLQLAVINDAYPDHAYTTALPIAVQKTLFAVLAPIGRLAGYEATYSREEVDDLR